jgi:FixJ family two-component response regulator
MRTADSFEARERAIRAGAKDFLVKPVDVKDFLLHVYTLPDTRLLEGRLKENTHALAAAVRQRTSELGREQIDSRHGWE